MDTVNLTPQTRPDQAAWLRRVETAAAEHARTRRALDHAIAGATAAGVPADTLGAMGQCEPGHGRHAGDQTDIPLTDPAAPAGTPSPVPDGTPPVVVGPLIPDEIGREVLVQHGTGRPVFRLCTDQDDLAAFVTGERPGTDLRDPHQVQWANRPGEWVR